MSSVGENKTLAEECEEVTSNKVVSSDLQNSNEAESNAFRRITRSMDKAKGKMPMDQKISKGLDELGSRMVVLALPAPSPAHLYEPEMNRSSKRKTLQEEDDAAKKTGKGNSACNNLKE